MATNRVRRFSAGERMLHWTHALLFFVMLGSGFVLYFPSLSVLVNRRPLVKEIHLLTALTWLAAITLILFLTGVRSWAERWKEIETIDREDRRWLRGEGGKPGRFNAGQKLNAIFSAAAITLFFISGGLMWLGEQDTAFRFNGTVVVHDSLMWISLLALCGHVYMAALNRTTRHSMQGMIGGSVDAEWAAKHHPRWQTDRSELSDRSKL